jgi:hypothetical protein
VNKGVSQWVKDAFRRNLCSSVFICGLRFFQSRSHSRIRTKFAAVLPSISGYAGLTPASDWRRNRSSGMGEGTTATFPERARPRAQRLTNTSGCT